MISHPLLLAAAVTALIGLLLGFVLGWLAGRADRRTGTTLRESFPTHYATQSSAHVREQIGAQP